MSDQLLTAMTPPDLTITYTAQDGSPYRALGASFIYVKNQDVAYMMNAYGFTIDTAAQVPAGDEATYDTGWSPAQ